MSQNKLSYFQGGEKSHEEAKKKRPYKAEPALVMQTRFEEPLYRNYDVYETEGVDGKAKHGPGAGYHSMQDYKSVGDFLKDRRNKLKGKYKANDSWKQDDGSITKKKARLECLKAIIKVANTDVNNGPNFDYGKGLYSNMDKYKSVSDFEDHADKGHGAIMSKDVNNIDFPIDDQINSSPISEEAGTVSQSNLTGGLLDEYLPEDDNEDKKPTELDFSHPTAEGVRTLTNDKDDHIHSLLEKYLALGDQPLYGFSDGLPEKEELKDKIDSPAGKTESGTDIYTKTWF
jgi:hypothetical protein